MPIVKKGCGLKKSRVKIKGGGQETVPVMLMTISFHGVIGSHQLFTAWLFWQRYHYFVILVIL